MFLISCSCLITNMYFATCSRAQGVRPEKKMVDGKQVEDYWASSKKVRYFIALLLTAL